MHHPIPALLARRDRWLSLYQLIEGVAPDFPGGEQHVVNALHNHIRAGDIVPRLADAETCTYEYGLVSWAAAPEPVQTELERVQAIVANWSMSESFGVPA